MMNMLLVDRKQANVVGKPRLLSSICEDFVYQQPAMRSVLSNYYIDLVVIFCWCIVSFLLYGYKASVNYELLLLLFESKHFVRRKSKIISYLLFVCTCVYAIQNGFELYHKQSETILEIRQDQSAEIRR